MKNSNRPRIAIIYDATRHYDVSVIKGASKYIRQHTDWEIYLDELAIRDQDLPNLQNWHGDGIIANFDNTRIAKKILASGLPCVAFGGGYGAYDNSKTKVNYIATDNKAIAELAFEHFVERGYRSYGYFGYTPTVSNGWSAEREAFFREIVSKHGFTFSAIKTPTNTGENWDSFVMKVERWYNLLPKPAAILAANDRRARRLLEVFKSAKVDVPDEVTVIGVDNDELLCDLSTPSLSSIVQDTNSIGRVAASLLRDRLEKKRGAKRLTIIPPIAVRTRASTESLAISDPDLVLAMRLVKGCILDATSPEEICRKVGVSRCGLEMKFKKTYGKSISKALLLERMKHASELVLKTNTPLKAIAPVSGFRNIQHMTTVFRRNFGKTPGAMRRAV